MRIIFKVLAFLLGLNMIFIFTEYEVKGNNTSRLANFVYIKGGTFTMGSPENEEGSEADERPQHSVTVSSFYMSKYEVTQSEYEKVMGVNPSAFKGYDLPVENVSWYDAVEYCNKRSIQEGLTPAYTINKNPSYSVTLNSDANGYRLPTEAEWEYACRAGTTTPFSTGNNITTNQANYSGTYHNNVEEIYRGKTTPVGSFKPNPWGLYDMHGNVSEWCFDMYAKYSGYDQEDLARRFYYSSDNKGVIRGGSWNASAHTLRSANRDGSDPSFRFASVGFRLVRR